VLRRELDRWYACRRFVYQFSLIAKPIPKKRNTGRGGRGAWPPRVWRPTTPLRARKPGLAAVKHQQAQVQAEAERAAATAQRGRAFTALAHVMTAATGGRPTSASAMPQPHRPPSFGQSPGLCCDHCHNLFTAEQFRRHLLGGCPALKAG